MRAFLKRKNKRSTSEKKELSMHGLIFVKLKAFIEMKKNNSFEQVNNVSWNKICEEAGVGSPLYIAVDEYPDEEFISIMHAASSFFHLSPSQFYEEFGRYFMKDLLNMYKSSIQSQWNSLDLLTSANSVMKLLISELTYQNNNPGASPVFQMERKSKDQILLKYSSPRRLCPMVKGLILGTGDFFKDKLDVIETTCTRKGDGCCTFSIELKGSNST